MKNLSFKSQASVIGRIERDEGIEGHAYWRNVVHCLNAIKIKKFPAKPEKHEKNHLRKIEGNKTSETSVISTGCCPEKDRKDSFFEKSSRNWDFQHFPIHSCQKGKGVAKCDIQKIFLENVLFCQFPRLSGRRKNIFSKTCKGKYKIVVYKCRR